MPMGDGSTDRLGALENNLENLMKEHDAFAKTTREDVDRVRTKLEEEKAARVTMETDLGLRLEKQAIGRANGEAAGLVLFVIGIIYATNPENLIWLVSKILATH